MSSEHGKSRVQRRRARAVRPPRRRVTKRTITGPSKGSLSRWLAPAVRIAPDRSAVIHATEDSVVWQITLYGGLCNQLMAFCTALYDARAANAIVVDPVFPWDPWRRVDHRSRNNRSSARLSDIFDRNTLVRVLADVRWDHDTPDDGGDDGEDSRVTVRLRQGALFARYHLVPESFRRRFWSALAPSNQLLPMVNTIVQSVESRCRQDAEHNHVRPIVVHARVEKDWAAYSAHKRRTVDEANVFFSASAIGSKISQSQQFRRWASDARGESVVYVCHGVESRGHCARREIGAALKQFVHGGDVSIAAVDKSSLCAGTISRMPYIAQSALDFFVCERLRPALIFGHSRSTFSQMLAFNRWAKSDASSAASDELLVYNNDEACVARVRARLTIRPQSSPPIDDGGKNDSTAA